MPELDAAEPNLLIRSGKPDARRRRELFTSRLVTYDADAIEPMLNRPVFPRYDASVLPLAQTRAYALSSGHRPAGCDVDQGAEAALALCI